MYIFMLKVIVSCLCVDEDTFDVQVIKVSSE